MTTALLTAVLCAADPAATSPVQHAAIPPPTPARKETAVSLDREERAVRQALAAFLDAVNRGDFEAVVGMITDDAVFWTADYPALEGKAAVRAAYAGLAAYRMRQDFRVEELRVCGDWAFARGYEDFTLEPRDGKGDRLEVKGRRAISILRRQPDGTWKTARGMTNFDSPSRPAARKKSKSQD
jgi:uncharacterized protein (TIGR02246 family)